MVRYIHFARNHGTSYQEVQRGQNAHNSQAGRHVGIIILHKIIMANKTKRLMKNKIKIKIKQRMNTF